MTNLAAAEDALLREIWGNPGDLDSRLVYADFLEDRGGPEDLLRAEFIRLQFRLEDEHTQPCLTGAGVPFRGSPPFACRRPGCPACGPFLSMLARERELLNAPDVTGRRRGDGWMGPLLGAGPGGWLAVRTEPTPPAVWRRGFVEEVCVGAAGWLSRGPLMVPLAPLARVRLAGLWPREEGDRWRWWGSPNREVHAVVRHFVPAPLAGRLGGEPRRGIIDLTRVGRSHLYPTREAALLDLSRAALEYAREDPENRRGDKKKPAKRRKKR